MTSTTVRMNTQGRVSIPAPFRRELDLTPETDLVSYIEDGRVVFEARKHLMRRIQHTAAATRTDNAAVADELISERRAAATRERTETEG